jgi:CheY-like chemotaxis protein
MIASPVIQTSLRVLVVEDNPVDIDLLLLALEEEKTWPIETVVAEDGEKAISWLQLHAADPSLRKPDFILLDLNLPRRDGTEVLRIIRGTSGLSHLPVAILSSSPGDIIEHKLTSAHVAADAHFTKPRTIDEFLGLGKLLRDWYEAHQQRR